MECSSVEAVVLPADLMVGTVVAWYAPCFAVLGAGPQFADIVSRMSSALAAGTLLTLALLRRYRLLPRHQRLIIISITSPHYLFVRPDAILAAYTTDVRLLVYSIITRVR